MSRRSEVAPKSNKTNFNLSLLEHALKDPASQNLILQLLSANKKNVFELFNTGAAALNSPVKRVKKVNHCESPTQLLRRRELEKRNRTDSVSSKTSEQSIQSLTPGGSKKVAYEVILKGVVAYAEINSGGYDRSGGVKALLRSMGATVCEKFTRDVTHVIFKDGLYTTFQRAKLLKVHLVSVLWLEASRQNGIKAQETKFPALGSKNYDLNVSMICSQMQKEYEEVLKDEIKKTLDSGTPLPTAKTMMEDRRRTIGYSSNSFETSSQFGKGFINGSVKTGRPPSFQKPRPSSLTLECASPVMSTDEDLSIMSKKIASDILNSSSSESFRLKSLELRRNSESDTASECGMIDGDFSQKETVLDDSLGVLGPLQSDEVFTSNMDITCTDNNCSESNRTSTSRIDMDLTTPSGVLQTIKGSLLNSSSYFTSKGRRSTMVKTVLNGKENHHVSTPGETSIREKQKNFNTTSTISKKKNVSQDFPDSPSSAVLDSENFNDDDDFYSPKTPKFKASKKNLSKTMNLMMQDEIGPSKQNECSTKNSNINCPKETSAENSMKFTPSSNSSLRMSKSSLANSGKPDVSSSILHSENTKKIIHSDLLSENVNKNVNNETVLQPLSSTPFVTERKKRKTGTQIKNGLNDSIFSESPSRNTRSSKNRNSIINKRKHGRCDDSICGLEIGNNNNLQESVTTPLSITQVEIGRNSKIITSRNAKHEINTGSGGLNSSDSPIRNKKKNIKECSTLNKEKQDSEKELKISDEEENEIETTSRKSELRTPRPERKYASITPTKSDVFISPFVNTRPRRKSAARALEKMIEYDNEISVENGTGSTRQISLIKRGQPTRTPKKMEKPGITLEVDTQLTEEGPDAKELSKIMEDDENLGQGNSLNDPLKLVVLLQDIQVSPLHNKQTETVDKPPQKKSMVSLDSSSKKGTELTPLKRKKDDIESQSEKRLRTTRSSTASFVSNAENVIQPSNEQKTERNNKRKTMGVSSGSVFKNDAVTNIQEKKIEANEINEPVGPTQVSKKKPEFNIQNTRMSRRIRRKLYDPNHSYTEQQIQEKLGVNDQEERETIRQKCFKVNAEPENSLNNGNVLMSQKALNFLEEAHTNTRMLFKEPETVLSQLGIEKNEKKEESVMEDSADEQVDLAEEFVRKKKVKKSLDDIQTSQKTPRTQKTRRNLSQKALTTGSRKRRSTMDFVPKTSNKHKMLDLVKKPNTIVCTRLHKADVQIFSKIVAKLGKFEIEDEVSSRTTHLVVGETKRTVNMLKAISRGCWILKHEWLLSSLEEGRWLPEEKYELTEFSSAVQECRLRRQAFGPSYHMNIFLNCGTIFVAKSTVPRCSDLQELITLCGGRVTKIPDNAKISVGTYLEDIDSVNEHWILDSISSGRLEPIENYCIVPASTHSKSPYV